MEEKTVLKNEEPMKFRPGKYLDNFMAANKLIVKDEIFFEKRELDYFNEFNKKSEKFLIKAWESFIKSKREFLDGNKSFEEIYKSAENKVGVDNLGVLCAQQLLDKLVRLKENELYYINFDRLKSNEEYNFLKEEMLREPAGNFSNKELLTFLRNAIAHNLYSVFIDEKEKVLKINIDLSGLDKKKTKGKRLVVDYRTLYSYINLVSQYIDEGIKEEVRNLKFDEREAKFKAALYNAGRKDTYYKKKELLDSLRKIEKTKTKMGIYAEVNDLFNYLIITNPTLKRDEVLPLLFKEINEKYTKEVNGEIINLPEKRTAWEFASYPEIIKDVEVVNFARYFITTKIYNECYDIQYASDEFKKTIDELFPNKKEFLEKKYPSGQFDAEVKNVYIEMMDNIRNSLVHDRLSIALNGGIEMFSLTEDGIEEFRLRKYALKQCARKSLQENGYAGALYKKMKENNISSQNKLYLGNFTSDEILEFCDAVYENFKFIKQSGIKKQDSPRVVNQKRTEYNRQKRQMQNQRRKEFKKETKKERKRIRMKQRQNERKQRILQQEAVQTVEEDVENE